MNENDQNTQELLLQAQEHLSESGGDSSEDLPVAGSDSDNAATDAVTEDPYSSGSNYSSDEEVVSGTVEESASMEETQPKDISFNVALLFVISMVLGLHLFSILSRKWHA